jgi:hypothetical protein
MNSDRKRKKMIQNLWLELDKETSKSFLLTNIPVFFEENFD